MIAQVRNKSGRRQQSMEMAKVFSARVPSKQSSQRALSQIAKIDIHFAAETVRTNVSREQTGFGEDVYVQRTIPTAIRRSTSSKKVFSLRRKEKGERRKNSLFSFLTVLLFVFSTCYILVICI